ncbi:DNA mismatch repair protein Mlh3 [Megalops cyprinoides]|uniref:DNA mismatch repair protein Mlh3 n=1 Tax=Megalops cyprinoides TaxID=118141 RepID=UPI0018644258|nr:DNA mismatch repair protein Mlh3 [Megalops cyprinoides]
MIKCLSKEVQAKLRSGVAIFSLQQCVEELVLNSIDAGATCIAVRLDTEACRVQVVDNGSGMDREDVERVGSRYFTSKCSSLEDLENLHFYGFRGEALASIAALATLLEISSRSRLSAKTFVKVFKDGKGLEVFESESSRPSAGTTVSICNFFHNMPVRRKRMDPVLECERIRQRVEAISLMHPSVSFTLKNDCTGAMVVQLSKARNTYHRFIQIHGLTRAQKLGEISLSHDQFEMSGYIGREGHYNSSLQFLFVNCRLVLKTRIHKLLNLLLKRVSSSTSVSPSLGSPKKKAGAELHGVYVINIKCHYSEYDICLEPAKTLIEFKDWDGVLACVEEGVKQFLNRENLVAELSPEDIPDYVRGNDFPESVATHCSVEDSTATRVLAPTAGVTRDCYDGKTLMSKAVHRRRTRDSDVSVHADDGVDKVHEKDKELSVAEHPRRLEPAGENTSIKAVCMPHSSDSETEGLENQFDSATSIGLQMSESLVDIAEGKERHHSIKVEKAVGITDSQCSTHLFSVKTNEVKGSEKQNMGLEESKEAVDDPREKHSGTCSRKTNECCYEEPLCSTRSEGLVKRTVDTGSAELKLGSMGFVKYLVPQLPGTKELSKVCSQGPALAQDLLPQKQGIHRDLGTFPSAAEPTRLSVDPPSQKCAAYPRSGDSGVESQEKPLQAPKRKMLLLGGASVIASKTAKVTASPKLALPVEAGSLDRFRRIYGKQTRTQSHPPEANGCETELSDASEVHPVRLRDGPITLSEYTRLKPHAAQPRSSKGSLAAKLSRLKHHQVVDKSTTLEEPHEGIQNASSSSNSTSIDMQDGGSREKPANSPLPSTYDITPDINANYQQADMEEHDHACDCPASAEFCKHTFTAAQNMPTQALSVTDRNGGSVQMVIGCEPDLSSGAVENCTGKDSPLPSVTSVPGESTQSESMAAESSDWLEHYDASAGKLVYINKVTGLSKYEPPAAEETCVPCVTDVTTMSVSVISNKGFEYKCYPFQTELVLPFLPRSGAERVLSSGQENSENSQPASSLSSMFSEWANPVFIRPPEVAVDVTSGRAEGLAVKIYNILYPYRFTKDMIHSMKVVHQVDKKFIACLINTRNQGDAESSDDEGNLLVLVDQHAAHERVRLENLVTDSYEEDPEAPGQKRLCSSTVTPPLEIDVTEEELRLLRSCQPFLRGLGLEVAFAETGGPRLLVGKVPACFVEREANESRRGRENVIKSIVQEYVREQVELLQSAGRVRGPMPLTVLKVLASQACHGAVKFNDSLSLEECHSLVGSLSTCQLPFQCAHGRPSMVPLADLLHLDTDQQDSPKPNLWKLRRMYRAWELFGKK